MGIVVRKELAENKEIPCHGYKYDGQVILWKKGIIGTLTDEQERLYCDPKKTILGGLPKGLEKRWAILKGLQTPPCISKDTKETIVGLIKEMTELPEEKRKEILKELEEMPTCEVFK